MLNQKNKKWESRYDLYMTGFQGLTASLYCRCGNQFEHDIEGIAVCGKCFNAEYMPHLVAEYDAENDIYSLEGVA